ncbi:hypothetical protein [Longimicrobium terrae]|uniref:Uncharacterized protein n=1 Tax=Longimicrobium terrae TaxID=1639882 RepID=A0A841GN17_9BACT|nr:hypothetical protein [Longimicrobium terrae]MBB4635633.1 hypothetical protein [Longimicrobium terrae]MBB6070027.1 hypothetical protein [Longimicrobium terrae]NNC32934.1 hypothetical protein [Longimicrobium terrae]
MPDQLFPIGRITASTTTLERIERAGWDPMELILRHAAGDFGDAGEEHTEINEETIRGKVGTILSVHSLPDGAVIWVTTSLEPTGEAHTWMMCPASIESAMVINTEH